jgi:uncharacterized repeat protein (TIGR04042 family)
MGDDVVPVWRGDQPLIGCHPVWRPFMPEQRFRIRWPDGSLEEGYSPSTIIREHLAVGQPYSVALFATLARAGLEAANARVRARFGMGCSQAVMQIATISATAARFAGQPDAQVVIEAFLP